MTEISDLLHRAAQYDREPEFSTVDFTDVENDLAGDGSGTILLVYLLARTIDVIDEVPESIAAVIRLTPSSGSVAHASIVVDPDLRSRGIVTLFVEMAGLDASTSDGWLGSGFHEIRCWAKGNHPASGRLADRWMIPRAKSMWKIVRPRSSGSAAALGTVRVITGVEDPFFESTPSWINRSSVRFGGRLLAEYASAPGREALAVFGGDNEVLAVAGVGGEAVWVGEVGRCVTLEQLVFADNLASAPRREALARIAAYVDLDAREVGLVAYVDSDDAAAVGAFRVNGFQHDRTDVQYTVH
ncbi:hypothetical protein CH299_27940 [Rhodococcus sp. 14-2686-1-2]|nr:hypothetical protein CH301_27420 [Rhodococcus sp. 15-1189-1-1a]OZF08302.1 hypothetical protein CH299_27940 [Rhodococcus sp. 14-2686-1-2]